MKVAFDVAYNDNKIANAVGVTFSNWDDEKPEKVYRELVVGLADYVPGEFYKRELPCILRVLSRIDISRVEIIVVDGFVFLDDEGKPGLGAYLFQHLQEKIPVIGVAKTEYGNTNKFVRQIFRGESTQPLFVSAAGVELDVAASYIQQMHGSFRIPTLLKRLDRLTKM